MCIPKRSTMLYSLKNQEQVEAWADIYTEMKRRWVTYLGGICGLSGVSLKVVKIYSFNRYNIYNKAQDSLLTKFLLDNF